MGTSKYLTGRDVTTIPPFTNDGTVRSRLSARLHSTVNQQDERINSEISGAEVLLLVNQRSNRVRPAEAANISASTDVAARR
jgi:hypothetical protein